MRFIEAIREGEVNGGGLNNFNEFVNSSLSPFTAVSVTFVLISGERRSLMTKALLSFVVRVERAQPVSAMTSAFLLQQDDSSGEMQTSRSWSFS